MDLTVVVVTVVRKKRLIGKLMERSLHWLLPRQIVVHSSARNDIFVWTVDGGVSKQDCDLRTNSYQSLWLSRLFLLLSSDAWTPLDCDYCTLSYVLSAAFELEVWFPRLAALPPSPRIVTMLCCLLPANNNMKGRKRSLVPKLDADHFYFVTWKLHIWSFGL